MLERFQSIYVLFCILLVLQFEFGSTKDKKKPIYIIGHMTNSIADVMPFLDNGANALESDIHFFANGSVREVYHGYPGDCFRICDKSAHLPDYLEYLRNITDPSTNNSYSDQLIMQFFDLKLDTSEDIRTSGREIASHVLDHLWTDGKRKQEIRALIYVNEVDKKDAISGFLQEFRDRNKEFLLKDVGFDGGSQYISAIENMFQKLNVSNIWLGDGIVNCFSSMHSVDRLEAGIEVRNASGFIKKVYEWTVDDRVRMMSSLDLGVDGFITNNPEIVLEVLNDTQYRERFRPATISDPPFERFRV